jgi:hypothetical protein
LIPCCHALTALYHCGIGLNDTRFNLIPAWFEPISVLGAYDYIANTINEFNEEVIIHIGLQAIDITRLDDYEDCTTPLVDDSFADLVVEPLEIRATRGRRPKKRREAGDGKGPFEKRRKEQVCSLCNEPRYNRKTCKRPIELEGNTPGLGVE